MYGKSAALVWFSYVRLHYRLFRLNDAAFAAPETTQRAMKMLYRMDKMTKSQREHFGYLMDVLSQLEWDLHQPVVARGRIPP